MTSELPSASAPDVAFLTEPSTVKRFPYGLLSLSLGLVQVLSWGLILPRQNLFDLLLGDSDINVFLSLLLWIPALSAALFGVAGITVGREKRLPTAPPLRINGQLYAPVGEKAAPDALAVAGLSVGASLLGIAGVAIAVAGALFFVGVLFILWLIASWLGAF